MIDTIVPCQILSGRPVSYRPKSQKEYILTQFCQNRASRFECEIRRLTQRHGAETTLWMRRRGGGVGPHILAATACHPVCLLQEAPKKAKAKANFMPHKFGLWGRSRGCCTSADPVMMFIR